MESNHSGRLSHVPSQPEVFLSSSSMQSRDKRLPFDTWNMFEPQGNVFGNQFSTFDSSQNHYRRIHHSATPGATGSVPVPLGTGTLVARDEDLTRGTIPMPTFARRPSTISSLFLVDIKRVRKIEVRKESDSGGIRTNTDRIM